MCSSNTATGRNSVCFVISNVAFSNGYSPITFGSKTGKNPLPIELLSSTALSENSSIQLDWATTSEINNSHFIIEKSFDAQQWYEVAKVTGSGNSNDLKKYQYFDKADLFNQINYYRLTQVDFDGVSKEFNAVSVTCLENLLQESYTVFPNPA